MKLFKSRKSAAMMASPYIAWAFIFIIIPLCMVIYYGVTDFSGNFTLSNISTILKPGYLKALKRSISLALISTLVCFALSYPLGMILASMKLKKNAYIVTLFILPMWMNFLLRTLTWMTLLEGKGVINTVLDFMHLPTINIINTNAAIVLGMVYNFLPFMILPIPDIPQDNTSTVHARNPQRYHHGIHSCPYYLRHFYNAWRFQDTPYRKYHRAGIYTALRLAFRKRIIHCSDALYLYKYDH